VALRIAFERVAKRCGRRASVAARKLRLAEEAARLGRPERPALRLPRFTACAREDGELVAAEEHVLTMTMYFTNELVLMLERAGFSDIELRAGYTDHEPTGEDDVVVLSAKKRRS
jgi:hypothetical protein